jgi:hypothetical protein
LNVEAQELLKDKRVWAVAGVGGVAGLVILMKGKSAGGTNTSAAGQGVQTPQVAGYDSTSSDVANQLGQYQTGLQTLLGQYGASQQAQLDAYQKSLTGSLSGLTSGQPTAPSVIQVKAWKSGNNYTADSVARRFGTTIQALTNANPGNNVSNGIAKNVTINVPVTATNTNQFLKG